LKANSFRLVINSNLGPISHRLATIHPLQTNKQTNRQTDDDDDDRRQLYHKLGRYISTVS